MKLRKASLVVATLALAAGIALISAPPAESIAQCFNYSNSRVAWVWTSPVCAYTGSGCRECSQTDNGSYCVADADGTWCVENIDIRF